MRALIVALIAWPAYGQVTVELRDVSASVEFNLVITGSSIVQIALGGGSLFDWCKPGGLPGTTSTVTTPDLGVVNNDGASSATITLFGPVTTRCDVDGTTAFAGGTVTVGGVSRPLVNSGGVWSATFGVAPDPPDLASPVSGTGSITWNWTAPTLNDDGTPLTDLAGYKLYWGMAPGMRPSVVTIGNPATTSYKLENLSPATYYAVVTAVNSAGAESAVSGEASKTVEGLPVVDPCVVDPLTFSVQSWPGGPTGRRMFSYTTNKRAAVTHSWSPQRSIAVDERGCMKTVVR